MIDQLAESLKSSQSTPNTAGLQYSRSSFHREWIWNCTLWDKLLSNYTAEDVPCMVTEEENVRQHITTEIQVKLK